MPAGHYKRRYASLVGQCFGMLTVIAEAQRKPGQSLRWKCSCDCGGATVVSGQHLRSAHTTSCGCVKRNVLGRSQVTHGMSGHPLYGLWCGIIARCENPKHATYKYYGGRGIKMCERWRRDFAAFVSDMGPRPGPRHSVDRKDGTKDYGPGNCKWSTQREQTRNTRFNRRLTLNGRTLTAVEWSEELGISYSALLMRLRRGWDPSRALTTEVRSVQR